MIFNSVTYLVFLALVVCLFWALPRRPRLWMLFLSSLAFYGFWRVVFIPVMMLSTVTDYFIARAIYKSDDQKKRKKLLVLSLVVNLGLLGFFKYLNFFALNAVGLFNWFGADISFHGFNIVLLLGISFYTFQTISYTIDVYRKRIEPQRDFVLFATYVTFFPQLVAGPILRAGEVIPQLVARSKFNWTDIGIGFRRILAGLFLKVFLADNLATWVDIGFVQNVQSLSALDVWTLGFCFGFQIYFDFSAYSHIAIGSARLMGIVFPENFNYPYASVSPKEFWKRWHISLSSWIRDYLYLPLAGQAVRDQSTGGLSITLPKDTSKKGHNLTIALFVTWAIMGFWHGANWTFVAWGLYHACFVLIYRKSSPLFQSLPSFVRRYGGWAVTLPVIMLGWIFFRADSIQNAFAMFAKVFNPRLYFSFGLSEQIYLLAALMTVLFICAYGFRTFGWPRLEKRPVVRGVVEWAAYSVVIALVFIYLRPINQFIYFQF